MQPDDKPLTALGIAPRGLFLRGLEDDEYSAFLSFRSISHWKYSSDSLSFFLPTHSFQICYSFEVQHCDDAVDLLLHYLKNWHGLGGNVLWSVLSVNFMYLWIDLTYWIRRISISINELELKWIIVELTLFVGWIQWSLSLLILKCFVVVAIPCSGWIYVFSNVKYSLYR